MANKKGKISSGIEGFDIISHGGIPRGRTTLISGASGAGKTVFSAQYLYHGASDYGENCVFVTFEERPSDIIKNMKGFGWDIAKLQREKKWAFVDASPSDADTVEIGPYDLGAFIARIEFALNKVKAKRIAIDSVSSLFTHYQNPGVIRRELYRLASRLKEVGVTCIMTAERPTDDGPVSRFGVEEFVSDNVILIHNRMNERGERERTIEVLKFRGASHDSEEAPLIVSEKGMNVYPRPKPKLRGKGFSKKVSTGIKAIDDLFYGGIYKNSSTLVSGASGTGKTVLSLHFVIEGAKRGENSILIEFEESPGQLFRNAASFGWDLEKYVKEGLVKLICYYPEDLKAEQYLKMIQDLTINNKAKRVVVDSLSALQRIYSKEKFREFVIRQNAFFKMHNVTTLLTNTSSQLLGVTEITETHLSTATDNIIILKYVELGGRMRRLMSVLKQRGSMHNKELMEYEINQKNGIEILGNFEGIENLLGGSARRVEIRFDETEAETEFLKDSKNGRI